MADTSPPSAGTELETVTSADGTEIAYRRTGSGPPLVLVHGSGVSDHRRWEIADVRATLAEHLTVYALDRRGRGASGDATDYELEWEVEDILAVVEAADEPVNLFGHSYGATIALEASLRTDDIGTLLLYEPAFVVGDHEFAPAEVVAELNDLLDDGMNEEALLVFYREVVGLAPGELETFRSDPTWEERVEGAHTLSREERAITEYELRPSRFTGMTTPTLLMFGGESPPLYRDATKAVDDALPNSRVVTFEGEQHVAMNNEPERFVEEVLEFVHEMN